MNIGRREQIILLVFIGIILFGGGYKLAEKKEGEKPQLVKAELNEKAPVQSEKDSSEKAAEKSGNIKVHVVGAVEYPGLYELAPGSRVNDAVLKAIPKGEAALEYINLADFLQDGQQIAIPTRDEINNKSTEDSTTVSSKTGSPFGTSTGTAGVAKNSSGKVNINSADEALLDTLPGIGPALAKRIIEYRQQSGPFKSVDEINNVSGIGEKKFGELKDLITI